MKVCVFGAGNMGARITEVFLNAGHDVTMIDIKPEFTERGKTVITHDYESVSYTHLTLPTIRLV